MIREVGNLMIYADNAATTKLDMDAFEAMMPFFLENYANASQPYSFSRAVKKAIKEARETVAACIGANPDEIFFTSGGTESDNWAIKGTVALAGKRHVITTAFEHHAVIHTCEHIKRMGCEITYLMPTSEGVITADALSEAITTDTGVVSVMMVNNEIGTIQPIKELCKIAHEKGALFHTDAVQAVGHFPIDVHDLGIDFLSASAHKFNGPKGIGFLYIKKGTQIEAYHDGGAQEYGLRAGTEHVAAIVGMATALKNNHISLNKNELHLRELEDIILNRLETAQIDFRRNGHGLQIPGNLSLSFRNFEGEMLLHRLDLMGIMVSTGSACDSQNTQISHVLKAIGADPEYALGTIRISLGKDNTQTEAEKIAQAIIKIIKM